MLLLSCSGPEKSRIEFLIWLKSVQKYKHRMFDGVENGREDDTLCRKAAQCIVQ